MNCNNSNNCNNSINYSKLIADIIQKYDSNLEIIYNKLLELDGVDEKKSDDIIKYFFENNCYYYNSTTNLYVEYSDNYKFINENNMLHSILTFITKYQDIYLLTTNQKQNIKVKIQKKIKERSIYDTIPESMTLQNMISFLYPNIFTQRNIAKYFMITLGDIILKKTKSDSELFYFIPIYIKPLITMINKSLCLYFYTINLGNYYKYKYSDHDIKKSRVIPFNNININHYNIDSTTIMNLICCSIHYSNRYENGDNFLDKIINMDVDTVQPIYWIKNTTKEHLIDSFISDYIYTKDGYKISEKDMLFLWKSYIKKYNYINIFTKQTDILTYIASKLKYNTFFNNVGSHYLPYVQNFKEFWTKFIYSDEGNYEINELFTLFVEQYNIKNINENNMYDLIHYYYPEVKIDDKYIQNIGCTLWNKKRDVMEFLEKNKDDTTLNINLYSKYCNEYKDKKRVSKHYFMNLLN
jgi:hypothetical protein